MFHNSNFLGFFISDVVGSEEQNTSGFISLSISVRFTLFWLSIDLLEYFSDCGLLCPAFKFLAETLFNSLFSSLPEIYVSDSLFGIATDMEASVVGLNPISKNNLSEMLEMSEKREPSPTICNINSNIQQVCLLLEGVENFSRVRTVF
jgi:hypothetical protein